VRVRLTPGLPAGVEAVASGYTPFCALPADRGAALVRLERSDAAFKVAWQVLPADPTRPDQPDLDPSRAAPPREVADGERIDASPGAFVRLHCRVPVRGGAVLPRLRSVRMLDR
jgi:hypothetical protein